MSIFKNWLKKLRKRWEPKSMEELIYHYGIGSCFRLFPPSLYRKHSPEIMKKLREAELAELRRLIEEYKKQHDMEDSE